ncbi:unnamed protein product [Ectocarpus fasciculatus]
MNFVYVTCFKRTRVHSCLCCCWPIGIFAIVNSNSVHSRWQSGDYQGANHASETAKQASIAAIVIGIIIIAVYSLTRG